MKPVEEMFNFDELEQPWEESFYEDDWEPDSMTLTKLETEILSELEEFLPRHMPVYDWNLPYAEEVILIIRRMVSKKII